MGKTKQQTKLTMDVGEEKACKVGDSGGTKYRYSNNLILRLNGAENRNTTKFGRNED